VHNEEVLGLLLGGQVLSLGLAYAKSLALTVKSPALDYVSATLTLWHPESAKGLCKKTVNGCGRWYFPATPTNRNPNSSLAGLSFYIHQSANSTTNPVSSLLFYHPFSV